jgi:hypothetical protein
MYGISCIFQAQVTKFARQMSARASPDFGSSPVKKRLPCGSRDDPGEITCICSDFQAGSMICSENVLFNVLIRISPLYFFASIRILLRPNP